MVHDCTALDQEDGDLLSHSAIGNIAAAAAAAAVVALGSGDETRLCKYLIRLC